MDRRIFLEDQRAEIETQCFHLNPDRWGTLYYHRYFGDLVPEGQEEEIPVTEIDEIDRFMSELESKRFITGAEVDDEGWL